MLPKPVAPSTPSPTLPQKPTAAEKKKRRALFDYAAQEPNELTFRDGDIITIVEETANSEWWTGELKGAVGLFPSNYTEPV